MVLALLLGTLDQPTGPPAQRVSAHSARGGGHLSYVWSPSIHLLIKIMLQFTWAYCY